MAHMMNLSIKSALFTGPAMPADALLSYLGLGYWWLGEKIGYRYFKDTQ
jgi:hypothetical protein